MGVLTLNYVNLLRRVTKLISGLKDVRCDDRLPSHDGRAVTRPLSTLRTRVQLRDSAKDRDEFLKSVDSGHNKRLSIRVESHFQDHYQMQY